MDRPGDDVVYIDLMNERNKEWERVVNTPQMGAVIMALTQGYFGPTQQMFPVDTGISQSTLHVSRQTWTTNGIRRQGAFLGFDRPTVKAGKPTSKAWAVEWGKGSNRTMYRMSRIMRKLTPG